MGIQTEAKFIYGWEIEYFKLEKYLKENNVGSCSDDEQCLCGFEYCWEGQESKFPEGCHVICAGEYYDIPKSEYRCFISLISDNPSVSKLYELSINKDLLSNLSKFSKKLGSDKEEPKIYTVVNIN